MGILYNMSAIITSYYPTTLLLYSHSMLTTTPTKRTCYVVITFTTKMQGIFNVALNLKTHYNFVLYEITAFSFLGSMEAMGKVHFTAIVNVT